MNIKIENPPIIEEILRVFPDAAKDGVVFCWGDTIYNPSNAYVPPEIIAHEKIHCRQQAGDPITWWRKYMEDPKFRFDQELPAHQAEYREFCRLNKDRNKQSAYLSTIAIRLSSELYGRMVPVSVAKLQISRK